MAARSPRSVCFPQGSRSSRRSGGGCQTGARSRHHERVTRGRSIERPNEHLALPQVLNKWVAFTAVHGAEDGLTDPEGAPLIPPNVVAALVSRHASREHWMFGEGVVVQVAADEMKDRYVLLLQLGRDPAPNWTVGEMGPLQYWITPEDLAAR